MPPRPSHLPHNLERTALQKMSATQGVPLAKLHPAGKRTIAGMVASRLACETIRRPRLNMIENLTKTTARTLSVQGIRHDYILMTSGASTKLRRTAIATGTKIPRPT
jgi:hypothetical protein